MGNILIPYFYFQITKKLTYVNSIWKLTHKHIMYIHFGLRKKTGKVKIYVKLYKFNR